MQKKFFLFLLIFASCFFFAGCSAGTPEEQQELAQALQSFGQEDETSSGWDTFFSQLEGEATAEASWDDVIKALNEKEPDGTSLSFPWNLAKDIFWGEGETSMPSATPMPTPMPTATSTPTPMPTATPEPTATPTPEAKPEPESEEDDGFHLFQKLKDFVY